MKQIFLAKNVVKGSYLKLTSKGFEVKYRNEKYFVYWNHVWGFTVVTLDMGNYNKKYVEYFYPDHFLLGLYKDIDEIMKEDPEKVDISKEILPDNFGKEPEELAKIMNEWQKKYRK